MISTTRAACTAALIALPSAGIAASVSSFVSHIEPLNGSGVSGTADLTVDIDAMTLSFALALTGLEPGQLHVQHIHGAFDPMGKPAQSFSPTREDDRDGDGFIELAEGAPRYGPIVLELKDPHQPINGGFPMTKPDGTSVFTRIFDLNDGAPFGGNVLTDDPDDRFTAADLLPLDLREIVIHGLSLEEGQGAHGGEADGTAGYKTVLPVAVGRIAEKDAMEAPAPIPLPAAGWALLAGLGGLAAMRRRR